VRLDEIPPDRQASASAEGGGHCAQIVAILALGIGAKSSFIVWRKTATKRMVAKLRVIKAELIRRKHEPLAQVGEWLTKVVQGYYQYHAVPGNLNQLSAFRHRYADCGEEF
jgi:hypothetical protein